MLFGIEGRGPDDTRERVVSALWLSVGWLRDCGADYVMGVVGWEGMGDGRDRLTFRSRPHKAG